MASTEFIELNTDIQDIEELPDITVSADFLSDPDVRKGFYYAFPFDTYMEEAWLGFGIRAWGAVPVGWLGYPEGEPYPYDYDPEKAEEHFRKAWGGQVWEEGFTIPAYYDVGNEPRRIALELLAESLANINPKFKLTAQTLDWPVFLGMIRVGKIPVWASADAINYAEYNAVEQQMSSWGAFPMRVFYMNEEVDAIVNQAALETDIEKRGELYVEAQKAFMEDPAIMFLAYPLNFVPMRDWVKGYYFNPFFQQQIYFYPLSKG